MDEPIDDGLDPAWEEPRGPHLPDAITSVPRPVWPFIGLAVAIAWQWWSTFVSGSSLTGVEVVQAAISASPMVVMALVGAALFVRHPDAWRTQRIVAWGAVLLAAYDALLLVDPIVRPIIEGLSPENVDAPFLSPPAVAYDVLHALVQVGGILCLARGLGSARRWRDGTRSQVVIATAIVAAATAPMVNALAMGPTVSEGLGGVPLAAVWLGTMAIGSVAWAYLAATATRGYRAGEDPMLGWFLAAVAGWGQLALALAGSGLNVLVVVIGPSEDTAFYSVIYRVAGLADSATWLFLLWAFALGLPADDDDDPTEWTELRQGEAVPPG